MFGQVIQVVHTDGEQFGAAAQTDPAIGNELQDVVRCPLV
jgi:hypothetical protein